GEEMPARQPYRRLEILSGVRRIINNLPFPVHEDVRRREALEHARLHRATDVCGRRSGPPLGRGPRRGPPAEGGFPEDDRSRDGVAPLKDALLFVDRRKQIRELAYILRRAEEQITFRLQREMENRDYLGLEFRAEIDQQVPTGNEVDARERRIADYAMRRE